MSDAEQPGPGRAGGPTRVDVVPATADVPPVAEDQTVPYRPEPEDRERRPWSRRRKLAVGSLSVLGAAALAFGGTTGWRVVQQKDAMLTAPAEVAGLRRDDSSRAVETADYLRTALAADVRLDNSLGVVYADPADAGRSVLLVGGTTLVWSPERVLDRSFGLLADEGGRVSELREVPAGTFGGVMKCGSVPSDGDALTVCGWADHGSLALALLPDRDPDDSAELLLRMRSDVQTRQ
ncbi:hypothetical protein [Plantactinospora sp. GCM10030261]|uniref:hypothetical protein n=1 Tax=Plantactinospora sp. GCM10030261 TaxID=3273420 RepID=UPI00361786A3